MIVYTYMVMDILHRGHLAQLENARGMAGADGKVVLGILTDAAVTERKPEPLFSFNDRFARARQLRIPDLVVCQADYSPLANVEGMRPDVLMECMDHTEEDIVKARALLAQWGGRVVVTPYYLGISSTEIKNRIRGDN